MTLFRKLDAYVIGAIVYATLVLWHPQSAASENYTYLADALLHGRTWIAWPPDGVIIHSVVFNGAHYIVDGPVPALFMLPVTTFLHLAANQRVHCALVAAVGAGATWHLIGRLGARGWHRALVFAFAMLGTPFAWSAMYGDGALFANVAAYTLTMLALIELTGRGRPAIVAAYGILAAGSRYPLIAALPFYFAYLILPAKPEERARLALRFEGPIVLGVALWLAYNFARWGVFVDLGPGLAYAATPVVLPTEGAFDIDYLGRRLTEFFTSGPTRLAEFPFLEPNRAGLGIIYTSPALIFALLARRPARLVGTMWNCAVFTALPSFFYFAAGADQFGMPNALDFEPFLIVLMALGPPQWMPKLLFGYSIAVGIWGIAYWRTILRP